jgi:transketolase
MDYSLDNINRLTRIGMRKSFGCIMSELAEKGNNFIVLAADVASSSGLDEFAEKFPNQFYNIGIAEQNMVGIASGLAKEGANVFVVSFAPFVSMRAYEAVRTLVGYMKLNVKVVGLASGFSLGPQGNTHYCFEDISLMRSIPGMCIMSPADCTEEMKCLEYLTEYKGPAYLRLTGIDGTPCIYKGDYEFLADRLQEVKAGEDVAIIATGSVVNECVRVARALKRENISVGIYNAHKLKPFDNETVHEIAGKYKYIVTVEEHNVLGGLGSIIADELAKMEKHPILYKVGIKDEFVKAGDYSYLLKNSGLAAPELKNTILTNFKTGREYNE